MIETIEPRWAGQRCIVAATGPSLTQEVAALCRAAHARGTHKLVAVNDAYRLLPCADMLYACDAKWWDVHKGCAGFAGEKWSSHDNEGANDKLAAAEKWGLRLVAGMRANGFSTDPSRIHYGMLSGFQAVNLALLALDFRGTGLLAGFDMHTRKGRHFFGDHPSPLDNTNKYDVWVTKFEDAQKSLPRSVEIVNCTPGSALGCFRMSTLEKELARNEDSKRRPVGAAA
jgi:hypothetical protein